jgi:hypothetical protein
MFISTGQACTHWGFLHCKQRLASGFGQFLAEKPKGTSSKLRRRTSAGLLRHL